MQVSEQTNRKREPARGNIVAPIMAKGFSERASVEPGQWVLHPQQPDWGIGQVQSAVGARVTVNFENKGKVLINTDHVDLVIQD